MKEVLSRKSSLKFMVIDDHESVLNGTVEILRKNYPSAELNIATNASHALEKIAICQPDLLVMDLSIPEKLEMTARVDIGIQFLKVLMENYSHLNLVVQSAHVKTLVRIRPYIDNHQGGFTVADKSLSTAEMLTRVDWSLQGLTHTKDIKGIYSGLEIKPEWLQVLNLAFEQGLQDKVIAKNMCISERMVRHYWSKLQDALSIYPEEGKNIRIQTEIKARAEGLID
ncbi:response regulator transcription factor [Dolichospermum circinale CS-534/05]|uniref:response regulator n=1 Tax=Dolichospermum circinale TaxID=109265 RepID=UPI002330DF18|nr:response regulator transcription factor [Dolichospermum circinale]MDB9455825.1 response regulator transcription factor [Dolichospermum circinale CS-541/06]MDB9463108.1 response regulator transcription factor [Dolichospermum circinale CS-541/04]MDB9490689.1 response regulator transcription factor [Dolichospermum circinale CS-534/05]MDB9546033.1 response regulator transcription factor [Dolichospermum circinale CS-1031]